VVPHDEAGVVVFLDSPGRREAALRRVLLRAYAAVLRPREIAKNFPGRIFSLSVCADFGSCPVHIPANTAKPKFARPPNGLRCGIVENTILQVCETILQVWTETKMTTRTIDTLLDIMNDPDLFTRRRIEAAEAILGFEVPPDAVIRAREFLVQVFENKEESIADRMDALQASRKAEAAKVAPRTMHVTRREEADRREAWRE
jgi:hypothetical protein